MLKLSTINCLKSINNYTQHTLLNYKNKRLMKTIVISKKLTVILIILALLSMFIGANYYSHRVIAKKGYSHTIVIDAGHGGKDNGASGVNTEVKEAELNLAIAYMLKEKFEQYGIEVILTRKDANSLASNKEPNIKRKDMALRREIIQDSQPDLVLSIHMNTYTLPTRRGAQVFFHAESDSSKLLADNIQRNLNTNLNMPYVGREFPRLKGDYYLLKCTEFTSVIIECAFLSSPEDEKLIISLEYQYELVYSIFAGTIAYLNHL